MTVSEEDIAGAVRWLFANARVVAEPSGAVTVAAALRGNFGRGERAAAVVSGGNLAPEDFARYLTA